MTRWGQAVSRPLRPLQRRLDGMDGMDGMGGAVMTPLVAPQGSATNGERVLRDVRLALRTASAWPGYGALIDGVGQAPLQTAQLLRVNGLTTQRMDLGADVMGLIVYDLRLFIANTRFMAYRPYYTGTVIATRDAPQQARFVENRIYTVLFSFWLSEPRRMDVVQMPAVWWRGDTLQAAIWRSCSAASEQLWMPYWTILARMREAVASPQGIGAQAMVDRLARQYATAPQMVWASFQAYQRALQRARADRVFAPDAWPQTFDDLMRLDHYVAHEMATFWASAPIEEMLRRWMASARRDAFVAHTNESTAPLSDGSSDDPSSTADDDRDTSTGGVF